MFVLQDCSICFEDYGPDRIPHSVACGIYLFSTHLVFVQLDRLFP